MNIREMLINYLKKEVDGFEDDNKNLIKSGLLDSLKLIQLISFIEDKFSCEIDIDDIDPESFETVDAIVILINKYVN